MAVNSTDGEYGVLSTTYSHIEAVLDAVGSSETTVARWHLSREVATYIGTMHIQYHLVALIISLAALHPNV